MRPLGIPAMTELHFEVLRQLLSRIGNQLDFRCQTQCGNH
uniref:Uncharacterized protein n=1 Tax=Candidatus Kentrum sp. MB TaxID=2138164 RepID=A0A450XML1_9GAMM|nr:MAG: hypothetical protein BECKMB1821I_GA0114274_10164 [Candidatus Kentron sp. MB]